MRIPSKDSFSPLPEVCALFGLDDPTDLLPELENQLESVPASMEQLREIVTGIDDARGALSTGAAGVTWEGAAAEAFTAKLDWGLGGLDDLSSNLTDLLTAFDVTPEEVKEFLKTFFLWLAVIVAIAGGIIGIIAAAMALGAALAAGAGVAIAALGLVGAILTLIGGIIGLFLLVLDTFPSVSEGIAEIIDGILGWLCPEDEEPVTPHCPEC